MAMLTILSDEGDITFAGRREEISDQINRFKQEDPETYQRYFCRTPSLFDKIKGYFSKASELLHTYFKK